MSFQHILPCRLKETTDIIKMSAISGTHTEEDQKTIANAVILSENNYERISKFYSKFNFSIEQFPPINDQEEYIWVIETSTELDDKGKLSFEVLNYSIKHTIPAYFLTDKMRNFTIISSHTNIKRIKKILQPLL